MVRARAAFHTESVQCSCRTRMPSAMSTEKATDRAARLAMSALAEVPRERSHARKDARG